MVTLLLKRSKKNHVIYQFGIADKDGDSSIGHFKVNKRGMMSFYGEEGTDDSKLSKDDPLLFKSDVADAFNWGDITKDVSTMTDIVNQVGHFGSIAAKGLPTGCYSPWIMCSSENYLPDITKLISARKSDDFNFGDIFSGIKQGISIAGTLIDTVKPIASFLL